MDSNQLRCDHCSLFIKTITIHSKTIVKFICNVCNKIYSRKSDVNRHSKKTYRIAKTKFITSKIMWTVYKPKIEEVKLWTPPFEARQIPYPTFRLVEGRKNWLKYNTVIKANYGDIRTKAYRYKNQTIDRGPVHKPIGIIINFYNMPGRGDKYQQERNIRNIWNICRNNRRWKQIRKTIFTCKTHDILILTLHNILFLTLHNVFFWNNKNN